MIAVLALGFLANSQRAGAATAPTIFSEKIAEVRQQILAVEQSLISGLKTQKEARDNVKKIQQLLKLQAKELTLGKQRVGELERTISALEIRRGELREKIGISQNRVRKNLQKWIHASREVSIEIELTEHERLEPAHAYVLKNMARLGIREITLLKADLADAEQLEGKIQEEQTQLAYLFQDLKEQESILELNKKLQFDVLQKKHEDRLSQLEKYRQLKDSELKVDGLISDFNAKVELKKTIVVEKEAARSLSRGDFAQNRGRLSWPVVQWYENPGGQAVVARPISASRRVVQRLTVSQDRFAVKDSWFFPNVLMGDELRPTSTDWGWRFGPEELAIPVLRVESVRLLFRG